MTFKRQRLHGIKTSTRHRFKRWWRHRPLSIWVQSGLKPCSERFAIYTKQCLPFPVIWSSTFYLLQQVSSNTQYGRGWEFNSDLEKCSSWLPEEPLFVSKWVIIQPPAVEKYSGCRSQQVHLAQLRTAMGEDFPERMALDEFPISSAAGLKLKMSCL